MNRAVFLDRDGVLNVDVGYTWRLHDLSVPEDVPGALSRLSSAGFKLVVITNQSGVARGKFGLKDVEAFHQALQAHISRLNGPKIDAWMTCPHHPEGSVAPFNVACECRKPGIRLITDASAQLQIDVTKSFLIGDKWSDILCGRRAGAQTLLVQDPKSLSYALPENVRISSQADAGGRKVRIASATETGPVEIHSSLSSAVERVVSWPD
ncbi:MAG: hypothetical protein RIQ81_534 [Pseudomonadota bacterium]